MSSQSQDDAPAPPTAGVSSLAPELTRLIMKHTDREGLKGLRQVSRSWSTFASEELFREIRLYPSETSLAHWNEILGDERIRRLPRHITIQTQEYLDEDDEYEDELWEEFVDAIASVAKLPNVVSLEICFSSNCLGELEPNGFRMNTVADSIETRHDVLSRTFQAIKSRAAVGENQSIRSLIITNLQNYPVPDFTASEVFHDVMKDLDELHLQIATEQNEHGPDHDYTRVELQTFPRHLCADWLAPVAHNLKALTIGMERENWGPFPGYFAPSNLQFPNLKTLHLRYYTIAHDDQLDWILAQKSLQTLVLQNCMIASRLRIDPENFQQWRVKTHDWENLSAQEGQDNGWGWLCSKYEGTWATVFDKITQSLPNLVDFKFNYSNTFLRAPLSKSLASNEGDSLVFPERYVVFDNGILPTHWPEADWQGIMHDWGTSFPNFHKDHLQDDQRRLDALLKECWTRAGGN